MEEKGGEEEGTACCGGNMHSGGAKRRRVQTPTLQSSQDSGETAFPAKDNRRMEAEVSLSSPADLRNGPGREQEYLTSSQFPRLGNTPSSAAVPFARRNQCANHFAGTMGIAWGGRSGQGSVAGGMFDDMAGLAPAQRDDHVQEERDAGYLCQQGRLLQKDTVRHLGEAAVDGFDGITAGRQECSAAPPLADSMDVCGPGSSSEGSLLRYVQDTLDLEAVGQAPQSEISDGSLSQESSSSGDHQGVTSPQTDPDSPAGCRGWLGQGQQKCCEEETTPEHFSRDLAAVELKNGQGRSDGVRIGEVAGVEAEVGEAAALRGVGVTGNEEFSLMFRKLKKLRWKWGPPIDKFSSDYWIMKPGAQAKTAGEGVEKFKTQAAVVQYVQRLLATSQTDASDSLEESEGEQDQSEDGHVDENAMASQDDSCSTDGMEDEGGERAVPEAQALQTALEALHPSKAPDVLTQRVAEFTQVLQFVKRSVTEPSGGSLYLCGCPGTGKTQTMAHVQAEMLGIAAKVRASRISFFSCFYRS